MEESKQKEDENLLKEKTKKISIIEASAYSFHDGFGVRFITPFALAIGKTNPNVNAYIGLLTSLPSLIGNLSQLFTIEAIERFKRKNILTVGVIIQALFWWSVIFAGSLYFIFNFSSTTALTLLVLFYTLLVFSGSFVAPVWVSLMKDIVTDERGGYFGKRNRIAGFFGIIASLIAGWLLDFLSVKDVFIGFSVLFFIAFLGRFISGLLFAKHYDPPMSFDKSNYFSLYKFMKKIPKSNFGKFTFFVSLFILATSIASPFFSVYMLTNLGFSYSKWMSIVIVGSLSSLFFMPTWGRLADKYGNIRILRITGLMIPAIPLLWILTPELSPNPLNLFIFIIIIESFSGMLWAGFNLSSANFIYDAVTRQKTSLCSSYFNILQGIGIFIGAIAGGLISSQDFVFLGLSPILFVFALSGIMRFFAYALMISRIKEVRDVKTFSLTNAFSELSEIHIKPLLDVFNNKIINPKPTPT